MTEVMSTIPTLQPGQAVVLDAEQPQWLADFDNLNKCPFCGNYVSREYEPGEVFGKGKLSETVRKCLGGTWFFADGGLQRSWPCTALEEYQKRIIELECELDNRPGPADRGGV